MVSAAVTAVAMIGPGTANRKVSERIATEPVPVEMERRLEQERRQQQHEQEIGREADRLEGFDAKKPECETRHDQRQCVRQADAAGQQSDAERHEQESDQRFDGGVHESPGSS